MRNITIDSVNAFMSATKFKRQNMEVRVLPNVTVLLLHDNEIAYRYNNPERTLSITNCGWWSNVTKERLNGIPNVSISQKDFEWYLNGVLWDGKLIDIKESRIPLGKPPIELSENTVIIPIEATEDEVCDMLYGVDNNQ